MINYKLLNKNLPDIQNNGNDFFKKQIYKVGINNYKVPLKLYYPKTEEYFNTIATVSAYASLSPDKKGINMSRFSQAITEYAKDNVGHKALKEILLKLKKEIESDNVYIKFKFNYLMKVIAPKSKIKSWFNIPIIMEGKLECNNIRNFLTMEINYTSLCPCSKEISKSGAHNQRSVARITIELGEETLHFEDLKEIVDKSVSCPIFNTLKRIDEKWVTERAYNNPQFSEDSCRNIAEQLDKWLDEKILDYVVVTENQESIHQSNAISIINAGRELN